MNVVYLGPTGTYSEEAARIYGGQGATYTPLADIDGTIEAVEQREADLAIVPLENSTEGSVARTLDLLLKTSLQIRGEVFLPIHHQFLSNAVSLETVTEVMAHPQSLAQCRKWLNKHVPNATRTPLSSNAQAAAVAAEKPTIAAIAGTRAAEIYNLPVLAANIEDAPDNTTRFFVLGHTDAEPTGKDKTSLVCSVPNRKGTLYELLGILVKHDINMTKLESRPATNATWDYNFFIDIDGHRLDGAVAAALAEVENFATFLKVIGSYPKA
jgi:chorismate mutase/prephenate dehydratase